MEDYLYSYRYHQCLSSVKHVPALGSLFEVEIVKFKKWHIKMFQGLLGYFNDF